LDIPAIEATALVRRFGDETAVDGIDLLVKPGEIYAFLGPNGAGKTTTVRMLVTLLAPSAGDARIFGRSIVQEPEAVRLLIGAALQEAALDDQQTGTELLTLQARLYGLRRDHVRRRIAALAELVDLGEALDRRIGTYSGGMKRRLDLAAALVHSPRLLFLDEPTTGLDPISRSRVWDEVARLNQVDGVTVFLTTQYLEEADRLADRVGIIDDGRIVADGSPDELKRTVGQDLVIVTVDGDATAVGERLRGIDGVDRVEIRGSEVTISSPRGSSIVGPVAVATGETGARVIEITMRTPTLDDVFLELTGARMPDRRTDGAAA
jgi:ABC-2 type transport system ATP-binding protein